jgi:tetratricopeptide (TPR) repeat protein
MNRIFFTLTVLILLATGSSAADVNLAYWEKANALYKASQYDSAARYYEKIAAQKPGTAELYYNLGNTYYRLNKIGPAVLNYERALHIDPEMQLAKDNLILTQNRITNNIAQVNDIFFMNWWKELTAGSMATLWAMLAFGAFAFFSILLFIRFIPRNIVHLPVQVPAAVFMVWACLIVLAIAAAAHAADSGTAVIMQNDTPMLNADLKGKPQSLLPEGTTVKISGSKDGYSEVMLPDGRKGMVLSTWLTRL